MARVALGLQGGEAVVAVARRSEVTVLRVAKEEVVWQETLQDTVDDIAVGRTACVVVTRPDRGTSCAHRVLIYAVDGDLVGTLSFPQPVLGLLVSERLALAVSSQVFVYPLPRSDRQVSVEQAVDTGPNPLGLLAWNDTVLAVPGAQRGSLRIQHLDRPDVRVVVAHKSALQCLAVSSSGCVATASAKGTVLRVFRADGQLLGEYRRGYAAADVQLLLFAPDREYLAAVVADRVQVFPDAETKTACVWTAAQRVVGPVCPWFSAGSFDIELPEERGGRSALLAVGDNLVVATPRGALATYGVGTAGAEILRCGQVHPGGFDTPSTCCSAEPEDVSLAELPPARSAQPSSFLADDWALVDGLEAGY